MSCFQHKYKGRVLVCDPLRMAEGGWLTRLYIRDEFEDSTQETQFTPDDIIYESQEEAAAAALDFGKRVIDRAI